MRQRQCLCVAGGPFRDGGEGLRARNFGNQRPLTPTIKLTSATKSADIVEKARCWFVLSSAIDWCRFFPIGCGLEQFNSLILRTLTRYANSRGGGVGRRFDEAQRQRLQVLDDSREKQRIAGTGEAVQPQSFEAVVGLQVCEAHLDALLLVA